MNKLSSSNKIYIGKSKISNAGRGVFAKFNIKKGEVIESCPIIELSKHETEKIKEGNLITYLFYFGKKKEKALIALGFGSIYNHTNKPNAKFKIKQKDLVIDFIALKNIRKNDEITIDYYNYNPQNNPLWFEVK